jgi:hypothetical protein
MITENTVFILGAGASNPYHYPTGAELRDQLCGEFLLDLNYLLTGSTLFDSNNKPREVSRGEMLAKAFRESKIKSIDRFLAVNNELSDIGKIAITISILNAEKKSSFEDDLPDNWYYYLYNRLIDTFKTADAYKQFRNNRATFITFNYDRSLEHYFFCSLRNLFANAPEEDIIKELNDIPIYHVYGKIDDLPWQGGSNNYGSNYYWDYVKTIKDNIKIIFERDTVETDKIKFGIHNAQSIYFLGFGYDETNMKTIGLPESLNAGQRVYGTAFGATNKEINDVVVFLSRLKTIEDHHIKLCNCKCVQLFTDNL